jgi:hypothetical protein
MLYRWSWNLDVLTFSVEASVVVIGGIVPMQSGQTFLFFEMFLLGGYSSTIMGQKS